MKPGMNLEQLEKSLPNGFHDAEVEFITVDYVSRKAVMKMQLSVGNPDAATSEEREVYKPVELHLSDVVYFVVEAPDPKYKYAEKKGLSVDAGRADEESAPASPVPIEQLPAGASAYWFFVNDWNSFIHVAAMDASLQWL
jgi:hypothetical protein